MVSHKVSIAIPVHDLDKRRYYISGNCQTFKDDDRVSEIILSVEPGNRIPDTFTQYKKLKIFHNPKREYVFRNKYNAISHCKNEWVIILDSDNTIGRSYLDVLYKLNDWNSDTVYQPDFLMPRFDCRAFSNMLFNKSNVTRFMGNSMFRTMLNAMNYLVNRDKFLKYNKEAYDSGYDPKCADSLFINYNFLRNGGAMQVVRGLQYQHNVHEGSFYKQSAKTYGFINKEIESKIKNLHE